MKCYLIILLYFLPIFVVAQQNKLQIIIKNKTNINYQNIGFVLLANNDATNIVDFKIFTKNEACFFMLDSLIADTILLAVQDINLTSDTIKVFIKGHSLTTATLEIKEKTEAITINEIVVTSKPKISNDTIVYQADKYNTAEVFKVEELIKKIADFTVDENGIIYYKKIAIKQLMVNGVNLSPADYTLISKNLNSSALKEIQAIKNFNNNRLLSNVIKTSDVAINLVLNKRDNIYSPAFDVGLGNNNRYTLNANMVGILKKIQFLQLVNKNTIALNLPSTAINNSKDFLDEGSAYITKATPFPNLIILNSLSSSSNIVTPQLTSSYVNNNITNTLTQNVTFKLLKKIKVFAAITHINNKLKNIANSMLQYNLLNTIFNNTQNEISENKNANTNYNLTLDYDNKKKSILITNIGCEIVNKSGIYNSLNKGDFIDTINERYTIKTKAFYISNTITKQLKESTFLIVNAKTSITSNIEILNSSSNKLNNYFSIANLDTRIFQQQLTHNSVNNILDLRYYNAVGKQKFNIGAYCQYYVTNIKSLFNFETDIKWRLQQKQVASLNYVYLKTSKKIIKTIVNAEVKLGYGFIHPIYNLAVLKVPLYSLNVAFNKQKLSGKEYKLQIKSQNYLPDILSVVQIKHLNNTSSLLQNSLVNKSLSESSINFDMLGGKLYKGTYQLSVGYSFKPLAIAQNSEFFNGVNIANYYLANNFNNLSLSFEAERYSFLFKTKFILSNAFNYNIQNSIQNNVAIKSNIFYTTNSLKAVTNFKAFTNFEFVFTNNYFYNRQFLNAFDFKNTEASVKNIFTIKKGLNFANTLKYIINQGAKPILLHNLSLGYIAKNKHIKLEGVCHNVFNYKVYTYQFINILSKATNAFILVPRYFLVKLSYQF